MPVAASIAVSTVAGAMGQRKAAKAQSRAAQQSIEEQRAAQQRTEQLLAPYNQAGQAALNPLQGALGIGGQTDTYTNPLLQQVQQQTMERLQQQASATGRTAPGDMAGVIAQGLIQPAYEMQQQRIGQLQNMANMGGNTAGQIAGAGQAMASNVGQMQMQQGQANAMGAAAPFSAMQNLAGQFAGYQGLQGAGAPGNFQPTTAAGAGSGVASFRNPLQQNSGFRFYNQ